MGVVWGCLLNERKVMTTKLIGHCGVDSGQILLIDPCYVYKGDDYDECCKVTLSEDKAGETTLGVVTSTYSGDGNYPVYATTDEHGGIMSVEIVFKKSDPTDQVQILIDALERIASMEKTDKVPDSIKADYPDRNAEQLEQTWAEYVNEYTFDNHDWLVETAQEALAKYNGNEEQ